MSKKQENKNINNWPVVGHKRITSGLTHAIKNDRLAHTYLFIGEEGLGKKLIARHLAKSVICQRERVPCGKCESCKRIDLGSYNDYIEIISKGSITINKVRDIKRKFSLMASLGGYRVLTIDDAADLTLEASNALLKFLEEPSDKTIVILITKGYKSIIPTIISRSEIIKFYPLNTKKITKVLGPMDESRRDKIIAIAAGRPGIAINLRNTPDKVDEYFSQINELQNVLDQSVGKRVIESKRYKDIDRVKLLGIIDNLIRIRRNQMLESYQLSEKGFEIKKTPLLTEKNNLRSLKYLFNMKKVLSQNISPRLVLENIFINI